MMFLLKIRLLKQKNAALHERGIHKMHIVINQLFTFKTNFTGMM